MQDAAQAVLFHLLYDGPRRLRYDAPVPESLQKPVTEIVGLLRIHVDIADGAAAFQADGVGIRPRPGIFGGVPFFVELFCLRYVLYGIPGQEFVDRPVPEYPEKRGHVALGEAPQYQAFCCQSGCVHILPPGCPQAFALL